MVVVVSLLLVPPSPDIERLGTFPFGTDQILLLLAFPAIAGQFLGEVRDHCLPVYLSWPLMCALPLVSLGIITYVHFSGNDVNPYCAPVSSVCHPAKTALCEWCMRLIAWILLMCL